MLSISLVFSMLCGCSRQVGQETPKEADKSVSASKATEKESAEDEVIAKIRPDETVTFDVYSQLSPYFGEQKGGMRRFCWISLMLSWILLMTAVKICIAGWKTVVI